MTVNASRRYMSPLRTEGARSTREAVLAAACELFVAKGFVATTVDQIADKAGVSKPTVFTAVGNKAALLKELRDLAIAGDEDPVPIADRRWFKEMLTEPDGRRTLARYARHVTEINDRYADIDEVLRAAAGADEALRQLWLTSEEQRLHGAEVVVANVASKATLRRDRRMAVDIVWTLTAPDQLRRLVRIRGWTLRRYARWLTGAFWDQLL